MNRDTAEVGSLKNKRTVEGIMEVFLEAKERECEAKETIRLCQLEMRRLREGRYFGDRIQVYSVGETKVKGYTRNAYRVLRPVLRKVKE